MTTRFIALMKNIEQGWKSWYVFTPQYQKALAKFTHPTHFVQEESSSHRWEYNNSLRRDDMWEIIYLLCDEALFHCTSRRYAWGLRDMHLAATHTVSDSGFYATAFILSHFATLETISFIWFYIAIYHFYHAPLPPFHFARYADSFIATPLFAGAYFVAERR